MKDKTVTTISTPTTIYYGKRENVIRELGGMTHIYPGKYLIQPDGNATFDADSAETKNDLAAMLEDYRAQYPDVEFVNLG